MRLLFVSALTLTEVLSANPLGLKPLRAASLRICASVFDAPAKMACAPLSLTPAVKRTLGVSSNALPSGPTQVKLGWNPYQNDHEDANGQFEMNWDYGDSLLTADRHAFFKYMVKSLAETHELRASMSDVERKRTDEILAQNDAALAVQEAALPGLW